MDELDKLRARIVELEVIAKEGLKTIEWFESWLNGREDPIRYDPVGLTKHPIVFSVNYDAKQVSAVKTFMKAVLDDVKHNNSQ